MPLKRLVELCRSAVEAGRGERNVPPFLPPPSPPCKRASVGHSGGDHSSFLVQASAFQVFLLCVIPDPVVMELQLFSKGTWNIGCPILVKQIPWFKGRDVATSLEYANPKKAVLHHVDDEDKKTLHELLDESLGVLSSFVQLGVGCIISSACEI